MSASDPWRIAQTRYRCLPGKPRQVQGPTSQAALSGPANIFGKPYQAAASIEFGDYEYQDKADKLVTAQVYDEDLARRLMFKNDAYWGYKEYMDLYRPNGRSTGCYRRMRQGSAS